MNQEQKIKILTLIQETLGVESMDEITPDAELISDLNASHEEINNIIKLSENMLNTKIDISMPTNEITVGKFLESIEESFI